jgi:ribosomal protein S18 acetylase RimI-like enzyme
MTRSGVSDVGSVDCAPDPDWRVLRDTIVRALDESPKAFLATADQVAAEPPRFWQHRLTSASWAVVQHGQQILGIAAAKPPGKTDDNALPGRACFIESVWIHPDLRMQGVGQRLVTYLIEQQRQAGIQEFYLWVFDHNAPAIRLYDRMDFKPTGRPSELPETQFLLRFDSDVIDHEEVQDNLERRAGDRRDFGITYRMLTAESTGTHLPRWD